MWILLFHGHFSNDTENENKSNPNINFKLMYMKQSMKSKGFERRLLLIMWGLFLSLSAFAQQISIKGHVVDATGEPVIGASVVEGRTTNGTITDVDGNFSLSVPANSTLTISFVGYKTQTVPVNGKNSLKVTLQEDTEVLDEVVVVGYGTMKKSDLTGAVSSVGVKDIKDSPVANIGQAMQGKVSGVQIIDAGKPGDNVTIKIRGLGTINNSNPLIVIDGIPTDLGLSSLNMADVERVDVLKDASATAIYGSRGANGVVMITSKRGAEGAGKVTVNANWAIQNATKNSLLLFDELGRGTATFDGMALAQSIIEYIHDKIGAKTCFSTHYHELTDLDKTLKSLKNIHVSAYEENGNVVFLHKIENGSVDKSYGIQVAKLAGVPDSVIARAKEIVEEFEGVGK